MEHRPVAEYNQNLEKREEMKMQELIFHQHSRYTLAKAVIEKNRSKPSYTILEVGSGAHGNLADFLPNDQITFLDVDLPEEVLGDSRFVVGDATNLHFEDASFDYVIGLDVLEHIPTDLRHAFFKEVLRVSREGVFLTFPHAHVGENIDDSMLREFYKMMMERYPLWLDDHLTYPLPTWQYAVNEIKRIDESVNIHYLFQANRQLLFTLLCWEGLASYRPEARALFGTVNDQYCNEYFWSDFSYSSERYTKTCIFVDKSGKQEGAMDITLPQQEDITQFCRFVENLLISTINLLNLSVIDTKTEILSAAIQTIRTLLNNTNAGMEETAKNLHSSIDMILAQISNANADTEEKINNLLTSTQTLVNFLIPPPEPEPEIVNWPVLVDVLLICYNQSKYIEDTLRSILAQQTEGFRYRVVVADDASKDDTVMKIQKMADTSGVEFVFLPHDKNHGIMQNYKRAFAACTSKYIAVMEGDDLWTDPMRLQKHVCFLESLPECAMSFNLYEVRNFDTGASHVQPNVNQAMPYTLFGGGDIAYDNLIGNFSTCVYRKEIIDRLPEELYSWKGFDWITNLMISRMGAIGCLHDVMNVYRIHSNGVWSGQSQKQKTRELIEIIDDYDKKLDYVYHEGFKAHKKRLKLMLQPAYIHTLKHYLRRSYYFAKRISRYCPPVFVQIAKLLIPDVIKEKMRG